jgi:lipopolysaccharide transport system ATP-binding protein
MGTISVRGLGKAYKHYTSRGDRLMEWLWPFGKPRHELKWVLRDVSFTVQPGHALGIIGVNGAGKSTLLKMITGTTQPTTGSVHMTGRVAALLELGLGFHPDFTGRQNAVMAAQLLGMQSHDIERLLPDIEAFAEIGEYIDEPVRVYSSGMQMRLAFSVATAVRPDVLIVDEALSVGDAYFQHKSFDRIRDFRARGTTLLLVSHDKSAIQAVCDEAILLNEGRLAMHGEPEAVMDYYNALIAEKGVRSVEQREGADGRIQTNSGTGEATIAGVRLVNEKRQDVEVVAVGQRVTLEVEVAVHAELDRLVTGFMIKDRLGQPVFGTNTHHLKQPEMHLRNGERLTYSFQFDADLGTGSYSVSVALHEDRTHVTRNYHWQDRVLVFEVVNTGVPEFTGTSFMPVNLRVHRNAQAPHQASEA